MDRNHPLYPVLFNFGQRAFHENDPNAMRFLLQEGRQDGWEVVVIGAVVQPGGTGWLLDHVWPNLPWVKVIDVLLCDSVQNLGDEWFKELVAHVPIECVFNARMHVPRLIREIREFPEFLDHFWPALWKFMDHVGARGLDETIECAAGCRGLKRALIRYKNKRRTRGHEIKSILHLLIHALNAVDLVVDRADLVM